MSAAIEPVEPREPIAERNRAEIDRELRLVDTAVEMVRRGAAVRVTLASMPLGNAVLGAAQARAGLYRLRVRPVTDAVDGAAAIVVERPED